MSDETKETTIAALRDDLARRGREAHQRLDALLATMSEEQVARPGVTDNWSVKDHLAHLTWWGRRVITVLQGGADPIDAMPGDEKTEDEINANVYAANRDRSLAEVRADFEATHRDMQQLIETLPDETLAAKEGWISGNSDYHYNEHIAMFQAWLASQQAGE
ncbi:MAG TPA: maleylpyruvate isomerase N-terminal domain-containing protein [Ktedonobacterales bacterium]|nr:maleylpyruvate isomerase N-terminal domain-containing protein [Ktedonobacterales bacterium]